MPTFIEAFNEIANEVSQACVACGDCFNACPITDDAGLGNAHGETVTAGILELISQGSAQQEAERWANACVLSGDCISACRHGVNPRLLLSLARMSKKSHEQPLEDRRRTGVLAFKNLAQGVKVLSQIQLTDDELTRLTPTPTLPSDNELSPQVVFYTGCNVLKTPHIALLCLDILDLLNVSYDVRGGPSHCCGILQVRAGDAEAAGRMGSATLEKFKATGASEVLTWCPSCFVNFTESIIPPYERTEGNTALEMTPFVLYLQKHLDDLRPHLTHRTTMKVALHAHRGVPGVPDAARQLLAATPGVEVIDLGIPDPGLMSNSFRALPDFRRDLHARELQAAADAGVDALAAVYHADHRELCAHERDWPFKIVNVLDIVGAGLGLHHNDDYKRLKVMQDTDAVLEDCSDQLKKRGIDAGKARSILENGLFGDQPLQLRGNEIL